MITWISFNDAKQKSRLSTIARKYYQIRLRKYLSQRVLKHII